MNEPVQFFDCNVRLGQSTVQRQGQITETDELLKEMDRCNIGRALVYHSLASEWSVRHGNEQLLEVTAGQPRLYPCFVGLPPATNETDAVDDFAEKVRSHNGAVRLFPKEHNFSLAEWCSGPLLSALADRKVPTLLDFDGTGWQQVQQLLADHPDLPLVLVGIGYRVNRYLFPLWETYNNLYIETATYETFRGIETVCGRLDCGRLIFGTGLPELDCGGAISAITYADLSQRQKAAIASGNMQRLLGLHQEDDNS